MDLRTILKTKRISQCEFASMIGGKASTVSNWCCGKGIPNAATRQRIADALGLGSEEIDYRNAAGREAIGGYESKRKKRQMSRTAIDDAIRAKNDANAEELNRRRASAKRIMVQVSRTPLTFIEAWVYKGEKESDVRRAIEAKHGLKK